MTQGVSVAEAAKELGVSAHFLRVALQQGRLPFGVAVKMEKRWAYYINPVAFALYMRGEVGERATEAHRGPPEVAIAHRDLS